MYPYGQNKFYDKKLIARYLAYWIGMVIAMKLTGGAAFAVMIPIAFLATFSKKPETLIFVMLLSVGMTGANATLVPKGVVFAVSQRACMAGIGALMLLRVAGTRPSRLATPFLSLIPYLVFMAFTSGEGWCPQVSYLKLFLFSIIFVGMYGMANRSFEGDRLDAVRVRSIFLSMAIFYIFGSILLIPFPGISNMSYEQILLNPDAKSLYMGMCNHSQQLGTLVGFLSIVLVSELCFTFQRPDKLYIALLLCAPILLLRTASRTGMGTFLLSIGYIVFTMMQAKGIRLSWRRKVLGIAYAIFFVGAFAVMLVPSLREKATRFIVKYDDSAHVELSVENILASRQGKIEGALMNYHQSPIIGNGFQVSDEMKNRQITGLRDMISAPVEKSTWTYAILEEGGNVGMLLFLFHLIATVTLLFVRKGYVTVAIYVSFVISNLGEFTYFSMSGGGGLMWGLVFFGVVMDGLRVRELQRRELFSRIAAGLPA